MAETKKKIPFLKRFIHRHQPVESCNTSVLISIKSMIAISILAMLGSLVTDPLVIASFASSCIILFSFPWRPASQPVNIIGGYLVSSVVSYVLIVLISHEWWMIGITLGTIIFLMIYFRIIHPPAGAIPIIFMNDPTLDWHFILFPILTGSVLLVAIACFVHRIPVAYKYPKHQDDENIDWHK
jgi:CBS-domain-containing membrane protein